MKWFVAALALLSLGLVAQARSVHAWGSNVGSGTSIDLSLIDVATGGVSFEVSRTSSDFSATPVRDLASDPQRHPQLVWAVRDGIDGNELIAVNPYREEVVSYALIDAADAILGIAIDPTTGVMYGAADAALYTINPFSGSSTLVGVADVPLDDGLGFDQEGQLFSIDEAQLIEVDKTDASAIVIAPTTANFAVDLASDPSTGTLYGLGPNGYDLVTISGDGIIESLGQSLVRPGGLAFTVVPEPGSGTVALVLSLIASRRQRDRGPHSSGLPPASRGTHRGVGLALPHKYCW